MLRTFCVLASTNVKVRIVLKGETDQIGDRVLRGLAQVFSLLCISRGCRNQTCDRQRQSQESDAEFASHHSGPLPAEPHAHHRPMLHIVNAIFPEPAILTKVYGERAITDHDMQRGFDAMDVEAVGSDHLPGEVPANAEAAHIAFEHKLLVWSNLMPDTSSHERIDPFEVTGAGDCSRRGALY